MCWANFRFQCYFWINDWPNDLKDTVETEVTENIFRGCLSASRNQKWWKSCYFHFTQTTDDVWNCQTFFLPLRFINGYLEEMYNSTHGENIIFFKNPKSFTKRRMKMSGVTKMCLWKYSALLIWKKTLATHLEMRNVLL